MNNNKNNDDDVDDGRSTMPEFKTKTERIKREQVERNFIPSMCTRAQRATVALQNTIRTRLGSMDIVQI